MQACRKASVTDVVHDVQAKLPLREKEYEKSPKSWRRGLIIKLAKKGIPNTARIGEAYPYSLL